MTDLMTRIRKAQAELAGALRRNPTPMELAFELSIPAYIVCGALEAAGDTAA